jgi:hypothetical protein
MEIREATLREGIFEATLDQINIEEQLPARAA